MATRGGGEIDLDQRPPTELSLMNAAMPLKPYFPFFAAAEADVLNSAFDIAWQEVATSEPELSNSEQRETLRTRLAECIVISHLDISTLDPKELAQEALRCFHETRLINHDSSAG
jgi:hypothetical protein